MKQDKRVLLVEDNRDLLNEYEEIVSSAGYSVDLAHDLAGAIQMVNEKTFHVAIIDIQLDPDDEHNQDGLAVLERLRELDEGTEAIILSGQPKLDVAIDAYEKFKIVHYLEKRKSKRPSDITGAVDKAFQQCNLRYYGPYRSLSGLLSDQKDAMSWEYECLSVLKPSAGIKGFHSFLMDFCGPYVPLLQKKSTSIPMRVAEADRTLSGEFWSKSIGKGVLLIAYPEELRKEKEPLLRLDEARSIHHTYEKSNLIGLAFTLSNVDREQFVERN